MLRLKKKHNNQIDFDIQVLYLNAFLFTKQDEGLVELLVECLK